MTTTPEDAAALFDIALPPSPSAAPKAAASPAAASGSASSPGQDSPFGGLPVASADNRRDLRIKVSWPGRVQLPNGRVVELRVRDISDGGVGLVTDVNIPAYTVLNFAMGVPPLAEGGKITPVSGTIKTTYLVVQGPDIYCGGTWVQVSADSRDLVSKWMKRLRR
jgi:hypothetical protein